MPAGLAVKSNQREKLERLCRYICRPPVSEKRLFLTPRDDIGYSLKTPYRDGTTHVIFEPLDFIARLAALVPPPRLNLTRFHWWLPCFNPAGGGDTIAAIEKYHVGDKIDYISTAGGAFLEYVEGKELPAIRALETY